MTKAPGRVSRLERVAYLLGLALLGVLGLAAAVLAVLSLWSASLVCLGLGLGLIAPLSFVSSRRQLKTFTAALRKIGGTTPAASGGQGHNSDVAIREMVTMLSRTNRQLLALTERVDSMAGSAAGGTADSSELAVGVSALRSEVTALKQEQAELSRELGQGWSTVRADLQALTARER